MKKVLPMLAAVVCGFCGSALYNAWAAVTAHHYPGSSYFGDVSTSSPHNQDVGFAFEGGVVKGFSDKTYRPAGLVTREEMATYVTRAMATSQVLALYGVDLAYADGAYFGQAAYDAGQISYDQYVAFQQIMDWDTQFLNYQSSQGNTFRISELGGAASTSGSATRAVAKMLEERRATER